MTKTPSLAARLLLFHVEAEAKLTEAISAAASATIWRASRDGPEWRFR
ncbi:hypothetical protein [Nonomuraea sp. NPDC049141]